MKDILSITAILITFVAFWPYITSIKQGKTKPHIFSWVIWGTTTFIVFIAQLAGHAGVGAWPIGLSAIITMYIAYLAFQRRGDITITKSDWLFFTLAMVSIPLWYLTSNPMWAVIILTIIDLVGFIPTIRKAYDHPYEEPILFFILMIIRNILTIGALEYYSVTTVLFPASIALACVVFLALVFVRRRV